MKNLGKILATLALFFAALALGQQVVVDSSGRVIIIGGHAQVTGTGGGPADPTNVQVDQGGASCTNSFSSGCVSNTSILSWTASGGATSYNVVRNGSTIATGVTCCTYTDDTATGTNLVVYYDGGTNGTELPYTYQVQAVGSGGTSTGAYAAAYIYFNGCNNSCGNYSGGGYNGTTASFTSGDQLFSVTAGTIYAYQGMGDSLNAIPKGAVNNGTGNPYTLAFGSICNGTTTTGSGGVGNYCLSAAATASQTGDTINGSAGPVGTGNSIEAGPATEHTENGHTYAMSAYFAGGGYIQQFAASPGAPDYDLNVGGFNNAVFDFYPLTLPGAGWVYAIHSRPGANASGTGDIYSTRALPISATYCSPWTANTWNHCSWPLSALGLGIGQFTGNVTANWQGTLTVSGTTATVVTTTAGSSANIASGDYIGTYVSGAGWGCEQATSGVTGSTFSVTGCPSGGPYNVTAASAFDDQLCASAYTTQPGPDNGGLLQGHGEPMGTYILGQNPGSGSGSSNPTGVGSCTGTGLGHWALFNGNGSTIVTAGSSGSPFTDWVFNRISVYKPAITDDEGSGNVTMWIDQDGYTH